MKETRESQKHTQTSFVHYSSSFPVYKSRRPDFATSRLAAFSLKNLLLRRAVSMQEFG